MLLTIYLFVVFVVFVFLPVSKITERGEERAPAAMKEPPINNLCGLRTETVKASLVYI